MTPRAARSAALAGSRTAAMTPPAGIPRSSNAVTTRRPSWPVAAVTVIIYLPPVADAPCSHIYQPQVRLGADLRKSLREPRSGAEAGARDRRGEAGPARRGRRHESTSRSASAGHMLIALRALDLSHGGTGVDGNDG